MVGKTQYYKIIYRGCNIQYIFLLKLYVHLNEDLIKTMPEVNQLSF